MTRYVVGFLFDGQWESVVLIRKSKPEWQRGKLNGVGGKIETFPIEAWVNPPRHERTETPQEAMAREFEEEAGVKTNPKGWHLMRTERFASGAVVNFLWASSTEWLRLAKTMEGEEIVKVELLAAHLGGYAGMMYNLPYLIEMARCYAHTDPANVPAP